MIYAHLHEHECLYPKGEPWDSAMHIHDTEVKGVGDFHTHDDPHEHGEPWILSDNFGYPQQKYPDWKTPPLHPEPESRFGTLYLDSDWEVPERKKSSWKDALNEDLVMKERDILTVWGFQVVTFVGSVLARWSGQDELRTLLLGMTVSALVVWVWMRVLQWKRNKK